MAAQQAPDNATEDLDFAIDTSALQRALPDFSDAGGLSEGDDDDDDDDVSIEIGRGGHRYQLDDSRGSFMSVDDSRQAASPAGARSEGRQGAHTSRPALQNISNHRNPRNGSELRKNAQVRRASIVSQKENLDPRPTRTRNNYSGNAHQTQRQRRQTLSDMHAKVAETYDGSYLGDERPTGTHATTTKNTRFGYPRPSDRGRIAEAVNRASSGGYVERDADASTRRQQKNSTWTDHNESFALPDVENLSELVSGIYYDGGGTNARQTRPRTTRFTSPPALAASEEQPEEHAHFDAVPIPEDEKAIFASLRLLQRKVSSLEKDNADSEAKLEQLRQENTMLRANQSQRQKDRSRLSGRDEDEATRGGAATLAVEKSRLEAANAALQDQLETARRKLSGHESSVQHAKHERNSLVNQLGTAYLGYQELKTDNDALRRENEELKAQLTAYTGVPVDPIRAESKHNDPEQARTNGDAVQSRAAEDTHHTNPRSGDECNSYARDSADFRTNERGRAQDGKYDALFSLDQPSRRPAETKERSKQRYQNKATAEKKLPNTSRQRAKKSAANNEGDTEFETTMDTRDARGQTVTKDLTYLSFVDSREIAQLRKTLEQERVARRHRRARDEQERTQGQDKWRMTVDATKSSFKDVTRNSAKSAARETTYHGANFDVTEKTNDPTTGNQNLTSDKENFTSASSRRGHTRNEDGIVDDVTSAFILPDITIGGARVATAGAKAEKDIQLSAPAQRALDHAVRHERNNCTVCKKDSSCGHDGKDQSVEIPKLAPVSERFPAAAAADTEGNNDEGHTLRPSQPPAIALAKVLKILEDELAHLKMQLAVCQSRYSRHDAAVGKKKRVKLGERMKVLMAEIENRSEVVYSLYDVLEGQKETGADDTGPRARAGGNGDEDVDGDEDSTDDDELPWEGFGSTQEDVTGASRRRV